MVKKLRCQVRLVRIFVGVYFLYSSISVFAQEIKLPPDPGRKNNETLLGIDANKNNVRDDVEIFIYKEITKDPKIYMAYLKFAESELETLKYPNDLQKLAFYSSQSYKDLTCLSYFQDYKDSFYKTKKLSAVIFNTPERNKVIKEISRKYNSFATTEKSYSKEERLKLCRF